MQDVALQARAEGASLPSRLIVIGIISFLTLVDLFAAQAILPSLTKAYGVTPAEMGFAVNASTLGMAVAGVVIALVAGRIDRRNGIWISLAALAVPTVLLGTMPDLATFTALRIVQGVFMSTAFTLTMAYLAEHYSASDVASALAAYVTGNVACNLFGRLMSASLASSFGLEATFFVFAVLEPGGGGDRVLHAQEHAAHAWRHDGFAFRGMGRALQEPAAPRRIRARLHRSLRFPGDVHVCEFRPGA